MLLYSVRCAALRARCEISNTVRGEIRTLNKAPKLHLQVMVAQIMSALYAVVMMIVIVGLVINAFMQSITSPNIIFLLMLAGFYAVAAILHPQVPMRRDVTLTSLWRHSDVADGDWCGEVDLVKVMGLDYVEFVYSGIARGYRVRIYVVYGWGYYN